MKKMEECSEQKLEPKLVDPQTWGDAFSMPRHSILLVSIVIRLFLKNHKEFASCV